MEIYIKPKKKAEIIGRDIVKLGDVADVYAPEGLGQKVLSVRLLGLAVKGSYVVSALDMVAAISAALPGHTVVNVGESDTVVMVKPNAPKKRALWRGVKVAAVALVLFMGSATAIMAFHTDSQLGTVFKKYHEIFVGYEVENPYIVNIPYAIGLALGIMVFFNHFVGKRVTREPTPIEVEMELYEQDVEDALIQSISREQEKQDKKG